MISVDPTSEEITGVQESAETSGINYLSSLSTVAKEVVDEALAHEIENLENVMAKVRAGTEIKEFITHEGYDLDNLLSIILGKEIFNAPNAKVTHVNANWPGPVPENAVALDICAGGAGIKGDNSSGVGSVASLIMERYGSAQQQERLGNLCNYVEALDSYGNPAAMIAPTITRDDKAFLMALGPNGVMKAILAGCYKKEDILIQKFTHAIQGMKMPEEVKIPRKINYPVSLKPAEVLGRISTLHSQGKKLTTIYIDQDLTLDAVVSAWALKKYRGTNSTVIKTVDARSDFKVGPMEVAINLPRTARCLRSPGKSVFVSVINHCSITDSQALRNLMMYVELTVRYDNPYEVMLRKEDADNRDYFACMDLGAFFRAYKRKYSMRGNEQTLKTMFMICNGMLHIGKNYLKAIEELSKVTKFFHGRNIALVTNPEQKVISRILLDQGVRCVIYVNGYNIGMQRNDGEKFELLNDYVKALIQKTGKEWYRHPTGFLLAWGASTANQVEDSGISGQELAEAMVQYLSNYNPVN